jgi:hypothetical protein
VALASSVRIDRQRGALRLALAEDERIGNRAHLVEEAMHGGQQ